MVHTLSRSKQESIRSLLKKGLSYSEIMKHVPGVARSTLSKFKGLYTPERTVADKTGAQKLKSALHLRYMSATFVAYTI
ncbi:hypothetical protein G6F55_014552 [Rhizopus delemar]|nr:hypothetical protein G6F55_014552 [Rhizopus delemar]